MSKATRECYSNMMTRCYNVKCKDFADYGGRGIAVCDRWRASYRNFLADMGVKPAGMTIERKNNDGPYGPDNCVWATRREQALNRRSSQTATVDGTTLCARDWADKLGVSRNAFHTRARRDGCEAAVRHYLTRGVRPVRGKNF